MRILVLCCALLLAGCNAPAPKVFTFEEDITQMEVTSAIPSKQITAPETIDLFEEAMDEAAELEGDHTDEGPRHTVEMTYDDGSTHHVDIYYSVPQNNANFIVDAQRYEVNEQHVESFIQFFEAL